jgi:hypothetical protein
MPVPNPTNQMLLTSVNYALIGFAGITNSGATLISGGNIGAGPGSTSITGITGANFVPPATTDQTHEPQAITDASAAFTYYQGLPSTQVLTSNSDMGLQQGGGSGVNGTYRAGVYNAATGLLINTPITLDAQGNSAAMFVFQAGSTVTQAIVGQILLTGGALANNVIWIVGSSWSSTGPGAVTVGNILSSALIALGGGVLNGRAFSVISGQVTIAAAETITVPAGGSGPSPIPPGSAGSVQCHLSRNEGQSVLLAWPQNSPGTAGQFLDLVQITDAGGTTLLNVTFNGTVNYPAVNPTVGTRIGVFDSRLNSTATLAALMADTWTNPLQLDIIQVQNAGGFISYFWNYLGQAFGS